MPASLQLSEIVIPHPLPALLFESPWLLAGLAAAAIPILIHLFFRRPHRDIPWAATRFLLQARQKHAPRIRLEQWLLLALRVLILVLVVLALARPRTTTNTKSPPEASDPEGEAGGGAQIILVLDASYSMAYESGGTRRFDRAQKALASVLEKARPGDTFQLARMTSLGGNLVIGEPSYQADQVAEALAGQRVTAGRADPVTTLHLVARLIESGRRSRPGRVVIASDFQRVDWQAATTREPLQAALARIREHAQIVLFDASRTPSANQVITSLQFAGTLARTGRPARFSASIIAHGAAAPSETRFELKVDGLRAVTESVSIAPEQPTTITFADRLAEPGWHGLELRLPPDHLPIDNTRYLTVPAIDQLDVLLVEGTPSRTGAEGSTYFAVRALAPGRAVSTSSTASQAPALGRGRRSDFAPSVIPVAELARAPLANYEVVILANVDVFSQREVDRLRDFARRGGGIVIALGDQFRPSVYNHALAGEKGLLPIHFAERHGDPRDPQRAISFSTATLDHPITEAFAGNPGTGLDSDFVLAYARCTFDPSGPVEVALQYATGDPAILTAPLGDGRVVLLTTSLGTSWAGPWPQIGRSYLPLLHEITQFAATAGQRRREALVGEPLVWRIPDRLAGLEARLTTPNGVVRTVPVTVGGAGSVVRLDEARRPGIYEFSIGAPLNKSVLFAVNVDPREGNPRSLSPRQRQQIFPEARRLTSGWHNTIATASGEDSNRWPISRWLLAAALIALLSEQVMAWRFLPGLVLLGVLGCLLTTVFLWDAGAFLAAAVLLAGICVTGAWWLLRCFPLAAMPRPRRLIKSPWRKR